MQMMLPSTRTWANDAAKHKNMGMSISTRTNANDVAKHKNND